MRKSIYDDFIYFDAKKNELIQVAGDVAWNYVWEYFQCNGKKVWWTKGFKKPDGWILIDRLPEGSLR
jgi:hypothetical protein